MTKKRLPTIATHRIQYQVPGWRALGQMPELDVHVYYGSDFSVQGYKDPGLGIDVKWDVPLSSIIGNHTEKKNAASQRQEPAGL